MTLMANSKDGEKQRGREAQTTRKLGRPRIIESPEEMDRLVEEDATVPGHDETRTDGQVKKGEETLTDGQRAFLAVYGEMGVIKRACKVAGVARSSHYEWMETNPEYRRAFEDAQEDAADNLEAEVYRRAVKGVKKPTGWYKGVAGGYVREYSDLLLMFRLKALRPEKYRERQEVEFRGALANSDIASLPDEAVARIAAGENIMAVLASIAERGLVALPTAARRRLTNVLALTGCSVGSAVCASA